jgi:EF-P beta-lysylation protein EpmB
MIPVKPLSSQMPSWQMQWRDSVRDPLELLEMLGLQAFSERLSFSAQDEFAFRVPRGFAAKMRYGDINDPLLKQVLPVVDEEIKLPGYSSDAVGDLASLKATGVLHKYQGRALLVSTGSCAIHCRYCFRREFPYAEETAASGQWQSAIRYLQSDAGIDEVLLSGGDPLSLSTTKLHSLSEGLRPLNHIKRLRIHTRLPVVLPDRIDDEFIDWIASLAWPCIMVIHANHPNELCPEVQRALSRLKEAGCTLLNQSVLLAGVNDDPDVLADLSEKLFDFGVMPYYLHQLDTVNGTGHFAIADEQAIALHCALMARLPGYLVPRLVREIAGEANKTPVHGP